MFKIYCLLNSGVPLTDSICETLFQTALKMVEENKRKLSVSCENVCGLVTTKYESVQLCSIAGYMFYAEIETMYGKSKTKFIVETRDLENVEKAKWFRFQSKKEGIPEPSMN